MEDYGLLLTYGPLGLWTLSLLYEKYTVTTGLKKALEKNTQILEKLYLKLVG